MLTKLTTRYLIFGAVALMLSFPGHGAMVGTTQLQNGQASAVFENLAAKRNWIETQLVAGGVEAPTASLRVAAMTDAEVLKLHQRIDREPAGGNAVLFIALVLLFTELTGYTDILPFIRPVD